MTKQNNPSAKSPGTRLAWQARREFESGGEVKTRCPKCGQRPRIDSNGHRIYISCPCCFVRLAELLEI